MTSKIEYDKMILTDKRHKRHNERRKIMNKLLFERVYNACNHELNLYMNNTKYAMTRKEKFFLTEEGTKPDYIIRQMRPLCIRNT